MFTSTYATWKFKFFEEADWYGGRGAYFYRKIENFQANEILCAFFSGARFRASAWFIRSSRNLAAGSLDKGPEDLGVLTVRGIHLFLYFHAYLARNSYLLYPLFTLAFSISIPFRLFNAFLVHSTGLYRTVAVFQIHANSLMFVSLSYSLSLVFFLLSIYSASLSFSIFPFSVPCPCGHAYLVSFTYLVTYSIGFIEIYLVIRAAVYVSTTGGGLFF